MFLNALEWVSGGAHGAFKKVASHSDFGLIGDCGALFLGGHKFSAAETNGASIERVLGPTEMEGRMRILESESRQATV